MRTRLLITIGVTILSFFSCKKESEIASYPKNSLESFFDLKPKGWSCVIYQDSLDSILLPSGVEKPLAVIEYVYNDSSVVIKDNPTLYLSVYDISEKSKLERIISESAIYSWCIPVFYGENEYYYVITSPCCVNRGVSTTLLSPLHKSLKGFFTRFNSTYY